MADRDLDGVDDAATTGSTGAFGAGSDLRRLSDLSDFEVADGYPDIRGWKVRTPDGQVLGKVDDLIVSTREMRVRYLDVDVDRSVASGVSDAVTPRGAEQGHALVPIGSAQLNDDGNDVVVSSLSGGDLGAYPTYDRTQGISRDYEESLRTRFGGTAGTAGTAAGATGAAASGTTDAGDDYYAHDHYDDNRFFGGRRTQGRAGRDEQRIDVTEEELAVGKRQVSAGEVEVRKSVETEHVREQVPVMREEVTVERRPVNEARPGTDIGEQSVRIPLSQEEVVVDKRPVVKEQVIVRKQAITENRTVDADLRREHVDVTGGTDRVRDTNAVRDGFQGRDASTSGAADRATSSGLGDRLADKVDNLKDRVDGNPASKPGPDATGRRI